MKASIFIKPGEVRIEDRPKPEIQKPTDAIIKIVRASVCGSDLWWFRGISQRDSGTPTGHEGIGIVESVGSEVTNVKPGDFVIAPFTHGCGHCAACKAGFDGNCLNRETGNINGYQAQYLRFVNANWALVKIPGQPSDYTPEMLNSFVTLSDVMATGYHAAATAEVKPGDTVAVMGDGAVGLCGVISAKLRGAKRIIAMSRHEDRQKLAREFGATDVVPERGDEAVKHVMELTGAGVDAVLECVGTEQSVDTATKIVRPGAIIGRVGIPQKPDMNTNQLFYNNTGLRGGIASVTTYDRAELLQAVLDGKINPGKVFTKQFTLDQIQDAYDAMDQRQAIKSLLVVDDQA
ncbi:zinc-dependent alcohol dehydrogenase family protein [Fructilactobacillus carniphilus]|uniref:Zinc-dependent alcohol dehydrogenase family protein n=1 Tax=Fructilactobacillus carniphilus TaxID=2940297 RepID=A0ABY5BXL9_9LACO|nr:zinc-dependent alcohol dehydrogenase family protein [Fructilactobacillus carniphilus]USS90971.1 zinc-dependent alcohol dehydrogenase family protein [Fructilactobacillus carniphilus]